MEKSNFDELLERYLTGKVTAEERIKIEAWLEIMKTENTDDLDLSEEDEERLFQKITAKQDSVREMQTSSSSGKSTSAWLTGIAASLLILASFAVWYYLPNGNNSGLATKSVIEKVILEDGTLAWLDPGSTLDFTRSSDNGFRIAQLTGSGLFEVAKDPEHPFIIQFQDIAVKVLGTSFRINTEDKKFELIVLTGKVEVTTADSITLQLLPNDRVNLVAGKQAEQDSLRPDELAAITENTEYNMKFSNASLEEVLHKLEKKFNTGIAIKNKEINSCRITADLTDHSLVSSLERIAEVIDIQFELENDTVTITGNGCK